MGGSSEPQVQQVQQNEPPAFAVPGLTLAAQEAEQLFRTQQPQFFPGSTVAPFAPETEEALSLTAQRARAGSPLTTAAQQQLQATIEGQGVNPFLGGAVEAATAPLFERFQSEIVPGLASTFERAGRTGSPASQAAQERAATALGRGVSEQAARLAFGSAEAERGRQLQAVGAAPQLANVDFANLQRLAQVGGTRENLAQEQIGEQQARFQFEQNSRAAQINQLINQLQGTVTPGAGISTIFGPGKNRLTAGLGGAIAGGSAGSIFGPPGAIIGAGLGGLGGAFG